MVSFESVRYPAGRSASVGLQKHLFCWVTQPPIWVTQETPCPLLWATNREGGREQDTESPTCLRVQVNLIKASNIWILPDRSVFMCRTAPCWHRFIVRAERWHQLLAPLLPSVPLSLSALRSLHQLCMMDYVQWWHKPDTLVSPLLLSLFFALTRLSLAPSLFLSPPSAIVVFSLFSSSHRVAFLTLQFSVSPARLLNRECTHTQENSQTPPAVRISWLRGEEIKFRWWY